MHQRNRRERAEKIPPTTPVTLRIIEEAVRPAAAKTVGPAPAARQAPPKTNTAPAAESKPTTAAANLDDDDDRGKERPYEQLLPGPSWPSGTIAMPGGGSGRGSGRGPAPSTAAQRITNHLSGQLDIPLVFRENTAESRAVAKFRKKPNGLWYFEYIDGEPALRAVLYEAFQRRGNLQKIDQLATELKRGEVSFVLEQTTKPSLSGWEQFSDHISYEQGGAKVIYSRTIFTGSDGSSGIILPDEEARRAIMRDHVALKRLMNSAAYISPIRDREIPCQTSDCPDL